MRYEWDEAKRRANLRRHAIDFADCPQVFDGVCRTVLDQRFDYSEDRFLTIGLLQDQVVVIAHTESASLIRIISARKATRHEQRLFFEGLQN